VKPYIILLVLLMIGWSLDSMTAGLISGTLTLIIRDLAIPTEMAGIVLSSWLIGMLIGGFMVGSLGDRIGRRYSMALAMALMGLFSFLSSFSSSWIDLSICRFFAGIGSSGYMVVASTLLAEYSPKRIRGRLISILESAWALGWLLSLAISYLIAQAYGWRIVFYFSLLSLIFSIAIWLKVPESARYLASKGLWRKALCLAKKYDIKLEKYVICEASLKELFSGIYLKRTIMLWIHWFCIVLAYWGIFLWLPHILYAKGIGYVRSLSYSIVMTLAQIPGYLSSAYLIEKIGRRKVLSIYMALAGVGSVLFWNAGSDFEVLIWGIVISFFNLGAWGATYTYTPELYPTRLRGTGSGWANSVGRVGGILGPYIAAYIMSATNDPVYPFILFALVHFVSAVTVFALGEETMGRSLEDISP